jgi:hypothetical protein
MTSNSWQKGGVVDGNHGMGRPDMGPFLVADMAHVTSTLRMGEMIGC